ncbi:lipopolysaccharide kinase InaA family protein [Kamptonema formosum]|uniref:lipopolysaccharide kinase InaA family protein n=1 Tax=Kamptonema formosum TaxID=331992 RepID=UPI0005C4FEFF|nr:lipopolysaccharide kinase InaA family protein [Oscillatoria sp. PCC 10802]
MCEEQKKVYEEELKADNQKADEWQKEFHRELIETPADSRSSKQKIFSLLNFLKTTADENVRTDLLDDIKPHRYVGGIKPIIYVFDDYNNYLVRKNNLYQHNSHIKKSEIGKYYRDKQTENLTEDQFAEILDGFCRFNLNNLSVIFDVKALPLWIPAGMESSYELIYSALPFDQIERDRPHIAAFLVDLEWRPTLFDPSEENNKDKWTGMGFRAIHVLCEKYPEIPSFVLTGLQDEPDKSNKELVAPEDIGEGSLAYLEKALTYGASWGFYKDINHHRKFDLVKGKKDRTSKQPLYYITLERQLEADAEKRYSPLLGEILIPKQLKVDPITPEVNRLFNQLDIKKPIGSCSKGKAFLQLIAELFRSGDEVEPVKVLTSGKSLAQATFFVKPKDQATRFIKIGPWLSIQREYLAYQQIIQPRLNSYTAGIIRKPVMSKGDGEQIPTGALMYSLAGFPEDYQRLRPLHDLMKQQLNQPAGGDYLVSRIQNTLEKVLKPLSHSGIAQSELKTEKLPLWQWLGHALPPLSGVLIPLEFVSADDLEIPSDSANQSSEGKKRKVKPLQSYIALGYKENVAWTLASFELERQQKIGKQDLSPWDDRATFENAEKILLSGWHLLEVSAQEGEFAEGSVMLAHPDLGLRIKLRGRGRDICRRFGATWIRPGMPVEVLACLDAESQEVKKMQDRIFSVALAEEAFPKEKQDSKNIEQLLNSVQTVSKEKLPNPFDYFGDRSQIPYHYTLSAHIGAIHGDFNLQNILFGSEQEQVGWLIDFERSQDRGMVAFDFAKLEVEIWNHHLTPSLANLANLWPNGGSDKAHYRLLDAALRAVEFEGNSAEFFAAQLAQPDLAASQTLTLPVGNALKAIAAIRRFALKTCKLDMAELRWALSAYFLNSSKFPDIDPWSSIFAFLASAWHLQAVIPQANSGEYDNIFQKIKLGSRGQTLQRQIDGLLIKMRNHRGE